MKAWTQTLALSLTALLSLPFPLLPEVRADAQSIFAPPTSIWLESFDARQAIVIQPTPPATAAAAESDTAAPAAVAPAPPAIPQDVNDTLRQQTLEKTERATRLHEHAVPTARLGEKPDASQVSIQGLIERGLIQLDQNVQGAYAYVQPYREPNDWAHINYCAAGAAVVLLSHWDANLTKTVDIDALGAEIGINPSAGAWVRDIVGPVNRRLNSQLGEDLNWYHYGEARSLADFRWLVEYDILQNGVPFITSLNTAGLPGWEGSAVGHIVCVYGYVRNADGSEYICYADTAPPASGYSGYILRTCELNAFWQAVSGNSAQVW